MATYEYEVEGPDGFIYTFTGPEGATQEEVLQQIPAYREQQKIVLEDNLIMADQAPERYLDTRETVEGGINQLLGGMTFGLADELGTGFAAGIAKGASALAGRDESYWDIRARMMEEEQAKSKAYRQQHPVASGLQNVAGALSTGGLSLAKLIPQGMKALPKFAAGAGIATGEGALAGAGAADIGERFEGAQTGAKWGLGAKVGLDVAGGTLKKAMEQVSKRRIEQELGAGEDFISINMATDAGALHDLYKKGVSQASGGRAVREQSQRVLDKAQERAASTGRVFKQAEQTAARQADVKKQVLDAQQESTQSVVKGLSRTKMAQAEDLGEGAIEQSKQNFRNQTAVESLPSNAPNELREEIAQLAPFDANKRLDSIWNDLGFSDVKSRPFTINTDQVMDEALEGLDDVALREFKPLIKRELDNAFKRDFKPDMAPGVTKFRGKGVGVERVPQVPLKTGTIEGDALMNVRNNFRMAANKGREEGRSALESAAQRKAASAIEKQIKEQLDDVGKVNFDKDLHDYGVRRTFDNSVQSAKTRGGNFEAKDWINAGSKYSGKKTGRGESPLQQEAMRLQQNVDRSGTVLKRSLKQISDEGDDAIGLVKTRAKKRIADVDDQQRALTPELKSMQRRAKATEKVAATMKKRAPNMEPGFWTQKGIATILGLPAAAVLGVPGAISSPLVGSGVAKTLGTEKVQRVLAGQSQKQKDMAKKLRESTGEETVIDNIIRGMTRGQIIR